ncbi:phosphate ABC transporter, permease protein PstA [Thermomicrobium roseum DSM 5159]|uniref:Phosphate transport system permease protein PstA n=2 Tax=Thermomicrobium roseum TaxID=500 RepID=B9L1T0_THERP|nr:phosphate ABC transporter permease PstA [Thermomicrobium roseum]ACM04798.1 phosphate ABC transporter, permease protein PstA [Thermomicrobium roseum DSM 5159]
MSAERLSMTEREFDPRLPLRKRLGMLFGLLSAVAIAIGLVTLGVLIADVIHDGWRALSWDFLTSYPSRRPEQAGIRSALVGSFYILILVALIAFPLGVAAAIYLEEFAPQNRLTATIEINLSNLAAVPSIVYGLLGLGVFVRTFMLGRSLLAGALTLSLLVLPIIIIASREALRAVPPSIREAGLALGASHWQTVRLFVLPAALPGILTGTILALARAIGETAPLITIGALTYVAFTPKSLFDPFTVLPIQIFNWISRPQPAFHERAAAGIIVLLAVLLLFNGLAIFLRARLQRRIRF